MCNASRESSRQVRILNTEYGEGAGPTPAIDGFPTRGVRQRIPASGWLATSLTPSVDLWSQLCQATRFATVLCPWLWG